MYSAQPFSEARNHSLYLILKEPVKPGGLKTKESWSNVQTLMY